MVSRRHAFRRGFGGHYFGPKWPCRLSLALVPVSSLVLSLRGKLQITRSHEVLIRFPSSWMHSKDGIQTNRCTTSYLGHRLRIAGNSDFCPEDRKSRYISLCDQVYLNKRQKYKRMILFSYSQRVVTK